MTEQELSGVFDVIKSTDNQEQATTLLKLISEAIAFQALKDAPQHVDIAHEAEKTTTKIDNLPSAESKKPASTKMKFSKKEIDAMSEPVKILLIYSGYEVRYRMLKNTYQVRFRRDGYNIELCARSLSTLKARFLDAIEKATPAQKVVTPLLKDYIPEWLAIKKTTVKETTLKGYMTLIQAHIIPVFGDKRLDEITRADVQNYLAQLVNSEKYRTAEKLKIQLNAIFEVAVADYNFKSPMLKVELAKHDTKKGKALTLAEEKTVVDYCVAHKDNPVYHAILILLYTGMRIGELASATLHDNYIECETEKIRKGKAKEFRKIPISPMLFKVMQHIDLEAAKTLKRDYIYRSFQKILPNKHTHELRYTFITRAKECGCNLELVMLWDGHKFDKDVVTSAVDRGYTTYSDDYYFSEIKKIDYEL